MSEDTKKVEETEQEAKAAELAQQDLDKVAGGQDCASPKLADSASPLLDAASPKLY